MAKSERVEVLERGDIYFAYRPKIDVDSPKGIDDVQRLYMVLSPRDKDRYRMVVIGQKKLPGIEDGGERTRPAARPAGEGVYAILRHGDHTHLAYVLELPETGKDVQRALNIRQEGSYIISVNNPETPSPRGAGLEEHEEAEFPKRLQERFRDRRFANVDPPEFLNHEGAELLLIGAGGDVSEELGIELDAERESADSAKILADLKLDSEEHPTEPLLKGEWA